MKERFLQNIARSNFEFETLWGNQLSYACS